MCTGDKKVQVKDPCYHRFSIQITDFGDCSPEFFSEDKEDYLVYLADPVESSTGRFQLQQIIPKQW